MSSRLNLFGMALCGACAATLACIGSWWALAPLAWALLGLVVLP